MVGGLALGIHLRLPSCGSGFESIAQFIILLLLLFIIDLKVIIIKYASVKCTKISNKKEAQDIFNGFSLSYSKYDSQHLS